MIISRLFEKLAHKPADKSSSDALALTYQYESATEKWYAHGLDEYEPDQALFGFKIDAPTADETQIFERLIRYYRHLTEDMAARDIKLGVDMWADITKGHAALGRALEVGDIEAISTLLREVAVGTLVTGFMNVQPHSRLRDRPEVRRVEAKWFVDKLLSLSEALGCFPIQGVEQGHYGFKEIDLRQRLSAIQKKLPFDLAPPAAGGGCFGYKNEESVFTVKDVFAIYTAEQVRRFVHDESKPHVAEIGGGTGTLAYYLVKAGISRVSVFDLPTVSIIQAYYLMKSSGPKNVWLYGEENGEETALARILPFWALENEPDKSVTLFVNQDSLPEMERAIALNYMRLFKKKGLGLFSINQEGQAPDGLGNPQSVVFELTETAGGLIRVHRYLHWMRVGYVEELYQL